MVQTENMQDKDNGTSTPLAVINGNLIAESPKDLYIPPDALRIFLETFEGPLDLLLYLIRAQDLDILELPVAKVTEQYINYIEMMKELQIEIAAEYLLMAAILAEIKSRMLLPQPVDLEENEEDPRGELIRRLLEYEQFKTAAQNMEDLPRAGRDIHTATASTGELKIAPPLPKVRMEDLVIALQKMVLRIEANRQHQVAREPLPMQERISNILGLLRSGELVKFERCFTLNEGVSGLVVSFLAILNLFKAGMIVVVQGEPYAPIYLRLS